MERQSFSRGDQSVRRPRGRERSDGLTSLRWDG